MKSVFEVYKSLWPANVHSRIEPLLSKVPVLHYPHQREAFTKVIPNLVVIVVEDAKMTDLVGLLELGFEHIVQKGRPDFPQELLASSLMVLRPQAFLKNPVPFFLSEFASDSLTSDPDRHLILRLTKQSEKATVMDWLAVFLDRSPETKAVRDLCLQSADELITNALFNAPVRPSGRRAFKDLPRNVEIELPANRAITLFGCFAEHRMVLGCEDPFGSLTKDVLLSHMCDLFGQKQSTMRYSSGGTGLGLRHLIENAANFYCLVQKGRSTLVACGFTLKGMKANMNIAKHMHLAFHD